MSRRPFRRQPSTVRCADRYARCVDNGTLVILGSGEIAPNTVKIYREVLSGLSERRGVMLDTPYGFQENVPQLTAKIIDYFQTSLQFEMLAASLLRYDDATALERVQYLETIRRTSFVFAGPGSPSYALKQWSPLAMTDALASVLTNNGVVCFSSAAALTLGAFTAPIYELYKVGDSPHWLDGLDLLGNHGLRCAVIPHYDNAEGGNHDTRFCYLGDRRLRILESMLEPDVATLGVDEHTAIIFDWASDTAVVKGRGHAYWRTGDETRTLERNVVTPLSDFRTTSVPPQRTEVEGSSATQQSDRPLGEVAAGGGEVGLRAIAELVRLAESGGPGLIDPAVLVEGVLKARREARSAGQYQLADELRDALVAAGIEVHDGPDGATWSLRES
jgi:hypothetical protein